MTRHLRFLFVAMLTIACSLVGKAAEGDTYKLVTDASELKNGDVVVIASGTNAMGAVNSDGTKIDPVQVTITDGILKYTKGLGETILESNGNNWYLKFNGQYISYESRYKENVQMQASTDKYCLFSISIIQDGNATVKNNERPRKKNLSFSNGSSFGYYDNNSTVQIYKKQRRANELSLSATSATTTTANLDGIFRSYVTLANPNNLSPITYKSSNTDVAEVNEHGEVKVNKSGETTITVSYAGTDKYTQAELSYTLTINKLENGIAIDKTSVEDDLNGYNGEAKQYVSLTNPNNLPITYTSSNPYVATVDESGNVKLVSWGKTTITVSYTGSEVYESATTSYELNIINSEPNYDRKLIEFVAGTDKGKEGGLPTLFTKAESITKDVVNLYATTTTLASNPYHFAGGSTSKISVTKGNIVKIEFYGSNLTRLNCTSEGTFDKQSNIACWLGSAKEVSFNNTQTQINYADVTNIRVYVEYPNVKTFEYNENKANNIEAWEISDITLNRTLVANKWNTLCVPFAISEEEIKANFGEGTLVEKFEAVNGNTVNFADATSIEAGVPYLIKPTVAGTAYTFNGKEVSADAPKTEGNTDVTFQGIYSPTDITNNGTVKAAGVTEGGKVLFVNAGSQTKAFRCFFTISDNASITPAMLKVSIKGVETAINSIVMDNSNATDNAIYNLQGQRVNGNSLTKGIYIKNGKKFAVK